MNANEPVKITERGWAGHFICANHCTFRRNTLIEHNLRRVVVSTVGGMVVDGKVKEIGPYRYYETMAFEARDEHGYVEADVSRQLDFDSEWAINAESPSGLPADVDNHANAMHDAVVAEFTAQLAKEQT